jgi:hypothetical protein
MQHIAEASCQDQSPPVHLYSGPTALLCVCIIHFALKPLFVPCLGACWRTKEILFPSSPHLFCPC